MDDSLNNIDSILDSIMAGLDVEKCLAETQNVNGLMNRLAPQEMDRLASALNTGLRQALGNIIQNPNQIAEEELKILQSSIAKELQDASEDLGIKDADKRFNVADFSSRIYENLPR